MSHSFSKDPINASMLYNFVVCPHRVTMDLFAEPDERDQASPFVQLLWERGTVREREVIAGLKTSFVDLSMYVGEEKERRTHEAMARKERLIYAGQISSGDLLGQPDLLRRETTGYVAGDIKAGSATEGGDEEPGKPKKHYAVQLALYADILERLGLSAGRWAFVWDVHGKEVVYDFTQSNDGGMWRLYEDCLRQAREVGSGAAETQPAYSSATCKNCVWYTACIRSLQASNDLTLIPELGRSRRDAMKHRVGSIRTFAATDIRKLIQGPNTVFGGIGAAMLEKFHERAQLLSSEDGKPYLRAAVTFPDKEKELFFDIEVDPLRDFCYLHGFIERRRGNDQAERFVSFFAETTTPAAEERAFADAMHYIRQAQPCAIYYYSKYERTIYQKLRQKYPHVCSEADLDQLFHPKHSVDLYFDVVLRATEWPTRDYSIKTLAQYLGFRWKDPHPSGAASIEWFNRWVDTGSPEIRQRILDYNEDDCRATRVLLDVIKLLPVRLAESWVGSAHFHSKLLRRKMSPEEYRVYRAALEWNLTDPIVIEKREDIKSQQRWRDRVEPYHHQVTNLVTFCQRLPVTLLADDVGLGKTISAGLIMTELMARSRLHKVLIICPKLLSPQWQEELGQKFNIDAQIAIGRELIDAEPTDGGAVITTYQSARTYLDSIPHDRFQMLVLDEAHKLRNLYGVDSPPKVALRFRRALEERRFRFVLMLTATPIHNRLWDLYSLVDLLAVARGHQNPFGSEGMFARKFIADRREQARQLKPEARDEFRTIVYSYMSRVRRGDAKLYFPQRVVQMQQVNPTVGEQQLIAVVLGSIHTMNRLAQISILQALVSSPEALMAQLNNMATKGTAPAPLVAMVSAIVGRMSRSAKLQGLDVLIQQLRSQNPQRWRLVIFTTRRETQTAIQLFLEQQSLCVGIINGESGPRNKVTLARFRNDPPDCHVLVSTEAGSEGVNLQVANVLVNYDLPWNPMIVEQRIGRVQRLASEHANVAIFNITLRGTFEEYIVGRLMEKLQMASHAIGDIDALLEASGIGGDDEHAIGFDEEIRRLVISSLEGKDVEAALSQAEKSIDAAKRELEQEEKNINAMLGSIEGFEYVGPRVPHLPPPSRSMLATDFTIAAFRVLGANVTPQEPSLYLIDENGQREFIRFEETSTGDRKSTLYAPGAPAFLRLIDRVIVTGVHDVADLDDDAGKAALDIAGQWVLSFGGRLNRVDPVEVKRSFDGTALVRVRATVAHDSYERLVEVSCRPEEHVTRSNGRDGLLALPLLVQAPSEVGVNAEHLVKTAKLDDAIAEFSRFYLERRQQEIDAAEGDERKQTKLEEEFTPRFEISLVGLEGKVHRRIVQRAFYTLDDAPYDDTLTITPYSGTLTDAPAMRQCEHSGRTVPRSCLAQCAVSGALVLRHLLVQSELSERCALPEFVVICGLTGKRILRDEAEPSAVTGRLVASSALKTSPLSGKRAEPSNFDVCAFTGGEVLLSELALSEISGKQYRSDQQAKSSVSGMTGHRTEFVTCHITRQSLAAREAERCEVTGHYVRRGLLEECAVTHKRVLPSELARCAVTGQRVLIGLLVESSVSGAQSLESVALRSTTGKFCTPPEGKLCGWSGVRFHPDDLRTCTLTGLSIHVQYAITNGSSRLQALTDLLDGMKRTTDHSELWDSIAVKVAPLLGGRCRIEAAAVSPDHERLALSVEVKTLLGLRSKVTGLIYEIRPGVVAGQITHGKRSLVDGKSMFLRK